MLPDTSVDEVKSLLDFLAYWGWGWDVVSGRVEAGLVGGIVDGDQLTFGAGVRVAALLDESFTAILTFAECLEVSALLGDDVVTGFVAVCIIIIIIISVIL